MMTHIMILAGCFPNCHPAGTDPTALQQSGNTGLGAAALILVGVLLWKMLTKGKAPKK